MKPKYSLLALTCIAFSVTPARGQVSLTYGNATTAYAENFNTLASSGTSSTLPTGWLLSEAGTGSNTTYAAGTGSGTGGDTYSFGNSTDRALGGLQSGSVTPTIGANFTNSTGLTLVGGLISYKGEQWRLGATGRVDRLDFQYSTTATSLGSGTYTDVDTLDFTAPVTTGSTGALDGNAAGNSTLISSTISGLNVANGSGFYIRWTDLNASGADDGLAVDDFSLLITKLGTNGVNTTITSIAGPSTLTIQNGSASANSSLTANVSTTQSFNGTLVNGGAATLAFAKEGAGTLTLGGTNTYTGSTTITTGSLALGSGGSINNSSSIMVGSGAFYDVSAVSGGYSLASGQTLQGAGTITGAMTVASGSTISPGTSPGNLNTGAITFAGGGNYNWQILDANGTAGSGWDLITASGALNITATTGSKFNINLWSLSSTGPDMSGDATNFNNASNYAWKIVGATSITGGFDANKFAIDTSGFTNDPNGGIFSISQSGNDLNINFTAADVGANLYWDGSGNWVSSAPGAGGTGTWADSTGAWDPSKIANFSGTAAAVTVGTATANKGINFLADGYSLSGGTLTLSATPADNVITVGSGMAATISSAISTSAGIIKSGAGNLIFDTTQSYTGGTSVSAGTLTLGHATDTLSDSAAITVSGTLALGSNSDTVGSLALNGGSITGSGTLTAATYSLGGGTVTANLGAGTATAASGTTALDGTFAGSLGLTGGTVNLGSADRIDNSSDVSISSGTLGMGAFDDTVGTFSISGGALGGSGTLTAATYSLGGGTVTANLGAGSATAASGTTALNGTLAGSLDVTGGTVNLGSADRLGNSSVVSISSGTLGMGAFNDTVGTFSISGGSLGGSGTLTAATYSLGGGTVTANLGAGSAAAASGTTSLSGTLAGSIDVTGGTVNLGSADRLGNSSAVSISSGTLGMGAFNDTVGSFAISGGALVGSGTLTAATYSLGGGTVTANLGAGSATAASGTTSLNGTLAGSLAVTGGTVDLGSSDRLGNTAVSISSGTLGMGANNDTVGTFSISGGTLGGSGTLTAATYGLQGGTIDARLGAGAATVSSGTTSLGSAGRLSGTTALAVNSGQLSLGGNESIAAYTQSAGTLAGTGTLTATSYGLSGGTASVGFAGSGAVTAASGTTNLNGNSTGFTGATTVSGGTLALGDNAALGSSAIAMSSGSVLGGDGITTSNAITIGTAASSSNYSENFNAIGTALPTNWTVRTGATSSSLGSTASLTTAATLWSSSGSFANYASATDLISTSSTADQNNSTNRALGLRQSGSFGDPGASINYAFNTTGTNVSSISFDLMMLSAQPRSTIWSVQYGLGATPSSFTSLGTWSDPGIFGTTSFSFNSNTFGTALNNQSNLVFRLVALSDSTSSGNRDTIAIDNFALNTAIAASGSGTLGITTAGTTTYSGLITVNNTATLTAATDGTANFTNTISGLGSITKSGAGTVVLSGANTYSGATAVNQGKLVVTDTIGNSAVTVSNAGTILASDTAATIGSTLAINSGAILAVGDAAAAGTATVTGATTFDNGSIFSWDIDSAGTGYDKLITASIAGEVAAGDAVFRIVASDALVTAGFWNTTKTWSNIFSTDGTDANAIANWAAIFGNTVSVVNSSFNAFTPNPSIGSFSLSGSTLTWTAVPEPTSALVGLLITAGLLRRRRVA